MKSIPVYANFDHQKLIGRLTIDTDKLPSQPDFHFALEGRTLKYILKADGTREVPTHDSFELTALSVVDNSNFTDKV